MLNDWITLTRVKISGADRLYPAGIDWKVQPGVNVVVGGTGLGKTTLIYATQFAIFGKLVVDRDRIEREFFGSRLTKRGTKADHSAKVVVEFTAGDSEFVVERDLQSGAITSTQVDGKASEPAQYEKALAKAIGLSSDPAGIARLQEHLFFFGEGRYLLAWENQVQNQLITLMLSEHSTASRVDDLWETVKSADSEARNLSAQAFRIEQDIKRLQAEKPTDELARRRASRDITQEKAAAATELDVVRRQLIDDHAREEALNSKVSAAYQGFNRQIVALDADESADLDSALLEAALADPTIASVRHSVADFYSDPEARPCPCCNREGVDPALRQLAATAAARAQRGNCIVCSKSLPVAAANLSKRGDISGANQKAENLQKLMFERAQVRERIAESRRRESKLVDELRRFAEEQLEAQRSDPAVASAPLQAVAKTMRDREANARALCERELKKLRAALKTTNKVFRKITADILEAFKKYARLYLDENCEVSFLQEEALPVGRGHQIKAPHSAFFPVISGEIRPTAQALSDAQRSFVDLAFRMALIEVWHKATKKTVTLFIETPEGAVDIAYMSNVAKMMRTFGQQGHTLVVTTNLNNDVFLPELVASIPKADRNARILNLLAIGEPRPVQQRAKDRFDQILDAVANYPVAR